jgi:hypothetical protein
VLRQLLVLRVRRLLRKLMDVLLRRRWVRLLNSRPAVLLLLLLLLL